MCRPTPVASVSQASQSISQRASGDIATLTYDLCLLADVGIDQDLDLAVGVLLHSTDELHEAAGLLAGLRRQNERYREQRQ